MRNAAPVVLIVTLIVLPLAIWAATSLGRGKDGEQQALLVERSVGFTGAPELLISLRDTGVTVPAGRDYVRIECLDGKGAVIVHGTQPWPFAPEAGYDLAHVHQTASAGKIEQARRCRVLGTSKRLEADVE